MTQLQRTTRACAWCTRPLPKGARASQLCCSKRCRQARSRFGVASAGGDTGQPMHFAYADPPYLGCAKRYYDKPEVDHAKLVLRLVRGYPHGWALSASSESLQEVLALIPSALEPRVSAELGRRVASAITTMEAP